MNTITVNGRTWTMDADDEGGTSKHVTAWDDDMENRVFLRSDFCPGGGEAHDAHVEINGECPWCGVAP